MVCDLFADRVGLCLGLEAVERFWKGEGGVEEGRVGCDLLGRGVLGVNWGPGFVVVPVVHAMGAFAGYGALGDVEGCFALGAVDVLVCGRDVECFAYAAG